MHFEQKSEPLLPFRLWLKRVFKSLGMAGILVAISLGVGVLGYHILAPMPWLDALLEASMILGGEGPIEVMANPGVKIFASFYALFSGFIVLSTVGVLLAPWLHRCLHKFHTDKSASNGRRKA